MFANKQKNNFFLVIDGSSLLATSYYGTLPQTLKNKNMTEEQAQQYYEEILQTKDGLYTNAIYGFMNTLLSILEKQNPQYIVVNWDKGRTTFRQNIYSGYKSNRGVTPTPLVQQQETMRKILQFIGIKQFISDKYEADDFSGSIANRYKNETYIRILTKDRDHLQLVNDKVNVWLTFPIDKDGKSVQVEELNTKFGIDTTKLNIPNNVFRITKNLVKPYYGVEANQIVDLKALMGDTADNIPGVKGIGEKTAILLLENLKSMEGIYEYLQINDEKDMLDDMKDWGIRGAKNVINKLLANSQTEIVGEKAARMSYDLAKIYTDINIPCELSIFEQNINEANLIASLKRLEFNKFLHQYFN